MILKLEFYNKYNRISVRLLPDSFKEAMEFGALMGQKTSNEHIDEECRKETKSKGLNQGFQKPEI